MELTVPEKYYLRNVSFKSKSEIIEAINKIYSKGTYLIIYEEGYKKDTFDIYKNKNKLKSDIHKDDIEFYTDFCNLGTDKFKSFVFKSNVVSGKINKIRKFFGLSQLRYYTINRVLSINETLDFFLKVCIGK